MEYRIMSDVLLSIVCLAYNHAKYIRDCLDGFVMQKTNFPFEILINDDCSTDGTAEIIREYEKKYPKLFKCVYQTENQWGKKDCLLDILLPKVQGKYVALCEGDDYWTDPLKLQKQVDFLETHSDYSICFHPINVHWEDERENDYIFPDEGIVGNKTELDLSDLIEQNFIQTNSVVYRWRKDVLDSFPRGVLPGDWCLHLLHAQCGKIKMLPDVMGVYRRNEGGLWTEYFKTKRWFEKCGIPVLKGFIWMEKSFGKNLSLEKDELSFALKLIYENNEEKKNEVRALYKSKINKKFILLNFLFYKFMRLFCFTKNIRKAINKRKRFYKQLIDLIKILND